MRLPIGYDNFRKIIDNKFDFVDKTPLIAEILDDNSEVIVITRPRRFGKTLNLSMLHHFLAATAHFQSTEGLFDGLKIMQIPGDYLQHQGKYPVISVSFKDVQDPNYDTAYANLAVILSQLYSEHAYLLDSPKLLPEQKQIFRNILGRSTTSADIQSSLKDLCEYLYQHFGIKPWVLIDEYDTPLQSAYIHGYYEPIIDLMRGLFSSTLKNNPYLNRAVITGILRIAKESFFSGMNNLKVYSVLQDKYSQYFGFTEDEVNVLLQKSQLTAHSQEIKKWYNGYLIGKTVIYNPWSLVNCIHDGGMLRPYWVNTATNSIIKNLLARAEDIVKFAVESILNEEPIEACLDEHIVFGDLSRNPDALWGLFLSSGYLKAITMQEINGRVFCRLVAPNYEVLCVYRNIIVGWFADSMGYMTYQHFLRSLTIGNIDEFTLRLQEFLLESANIFDIGEKHPEKFYHGFVMGMMISLKDTHIVQSNRESGFGRYDVMLIPKDKQQMGIVLEFKIAAVNETDLTAAAREALKQIDQRHYVATLKQHGIQHILKLGLAFKGKQVAVVST